MLTVVLSWVFACTLYDRARVVIVRYGPGLDSKVLTPIVVDLGTPCLIVSTLLKTAIAPEAFVMVAMPHVLHAVLQVLAPWCFGSLDYG